MIMWLASYPKSGNTWMRALLSCYLFDQYHDENQDVFSKMKIIKSFPKKFAFKGIVDENYLIKNKLGAYKYFIKAQEKINKDPNLHIIKTHNFCGSSNGYEFTNKQNTIGSIYIVRDPRDVAVSYASFADISYKESVSLLFNDNRISFNDKYYPEARLSWKTHLISWLSFPAPRLIVRYEDLLKNTEGILRSTIIFINQFLNNKITVDEDKITRVVSECDFNKLKYLENKKGFDENEDWLDETKKKLFKNSNKQKRFFRKGKEKSWENVLPESLIKQIENSFSKEMKKLNYI
jgi:hypothetical protein